MPEDNKIRLKVATPAGVYEGIFAETDKVYEVITIVVKEKRLVEGDAFELTLNGEVLPDDSPLSNFDLKDDAILDLIASGSAV